MSNVIDAVPRFARATAEACVNSWTREQTEENMQRMGKEYEREVVKQLEIMQLERLLLDT